MTVRVHEEADASGFIHPDAQNHCDWYLHLNDPAWATPVGSGWVAQSPLTPNTSNAPVTYRLLLSWATNAVQRFSSSAQLLGHNGKHSLSLVQVNGVATNQLTFQPVTTGPTYTRSPDPKFANVQNLVITGVTGNAGKADYIKFDPDSTDPNLATPPITFTIADQGDPHRYRWTVLVKDTRTATYIDAATIKGIGFGPGTITVKVNDSAALAQNPDSLPLVPKVSGQDTALQAWGTYSFDIFVKEFATDADAQANGSNYLDYQAYRSPYKLQIPATYQGIDPDTGQTTQLPGHKVFFESDGESYINVRASYYLTDASNTAANSIQIDLLNPNLDLLASKSNLPTSVNTPHPAVDEDAYLLYTLNANTGIDPGDLICLFTGEDNHGAEYRDHKNHRMLAVNQRKSVNPVEWVSGGHYGNTSDWVGVWVKPWMMKTGSAGIKTQQLPLIGAYTGDGDVDLPSTIKAVKNELSTATSRAGTTRAAINGILWEDAGSSMRSYVDDGFVGVGNPTWLGYLPKTSSQRWAFGTGSGQKTLSSAQCIPWTVSGQSGYAPSASFRNVNPFGLSNLPALVLNGAQVPTNNAYTGGGATGSWARDNTYGFDRSLIGWTASGNFFMIHSTGGSAFGANISGWVWLQAGAFMTNQDSEDYVEGPLGQVYPLHDKALGNWIRDNMSNTYLNSKGRAVSTPYTPIINQAYHLDGGSHSDLVYIRVKRKLVAPGITGLVAGSEHYQDGWETKGNHSMVKAYVR